MNVKDKLEGFSKIAIREAEAQRVGILNEMNREYQRACAETTVRAEKKAEHILNEESYKAEQQKNKEILAASVAAKKSLIDLRKSLKERLFKDVMALLADYIETPAYEQFLIADIKKLALQYGGEITVYLCRRDMVFARRLMENPNITVLEDKDDLIGGYRAVIGGAHVMIDNSYKEKLKEAEESFNGFKLS